MIEGIIIGAPLPVSEFDEWVVIRFLGGFAYNRYLVILFGFYILSFLIGMISAWALIAPTFRQLLKRHEVTVSEKQLGARVVVDLIIAAIVIMFIFSPTLAYLVKYPKALPSITYVSFISGYALTGFITGNAVTKSLLPFEVYWKCKKQNLTISSVYVETNARTGTESAKSIKWALASEGAARSAP